MEYARVERYGIDAAALSTHLLRSTVLVEVEGGGRLESEVAFVAEPANAVCEQDSETAIVP